MTSFTFTGKRVHYPRRYNTNWWHSFDRRGWSQCSHNGYMTGMWRNDRKNPDRIYRIEMVECQGAPRYNRASRVSQVCYNHNWWGSFDRKGWSTCNNGYFMKGLYRTSGSYLNNIEEAKCCRPRGAVKRWGRCYNHNVWRSFDHKGWSRCHSGYYMTGLYRNSCNQLYCLEEFKCCKMGTSPGVGHVLHPPKSIANWWHHFDRQGWSQCGHNRYMTGMWRNNRGKPDKIYRIEMAECQGVPRRRQLKSFGQVCYNHNWWKSFDHKGWSTCRNGYYMKGLYRTSGHYLHNIEEAKCCRPRGIVRKWRHCYNQNVWRSFDHKGWSRCHPGYYMTGLYRNSCDELYCIEQFKCCKIAI